MLNIKFLGSLGVLALSAFQSEALMVGQDLQFGYYYPDLATEYDSPSAIHTIAPGGTTFSYQPTLLNFDIVLTDSSITISDFAWNGDQSGSPLMATTADFNGIVIFNLSGAFPTLSTVSSSGLTGFEASDVLVSGSVITLNFESMVYASGLSEVVLEFTPSGVPETGATVALLGCAFAAIGLLRGRIMDQDPSSPSV